MSLSSWTTTQLVGGLMLSTGLWILIRKLTKADPLGNIRGPPAISWAKGSFPDLVGTRGLEFHRRISDEYGGVLKLKLFFGEDVLYVYDPKALQHVVVKDQDVYEEPDYFIFGNEVTFGKGLLATLGDHHKKQRKILNPVFSAVHMRDMIPTFYEVVNKLCNTFSKKVQSGPATVDILAWTSRTALELIGQSGLGCSFDSLDENGDQHPYSISVKLLVPAVMKLSVFRYVFLSSAARVGPARFRRAMVDFLSLFMENLRRVKDIVDVMHNTSVEIFESKKRALKEGSDEKEEKDIISILMRANAAASEEDRLPDEEVLGQISTLTFAAMDTTSTAVTRILQLLSEHPDVQEKLRREISEAHGVHGPELGYDELSNLPYLDAVCRETLRVYPSVPNMSRVARRDMILPLSKPITGVDGRPIHEIHVPEGTRIFISVVASNRNPDLWGPDADEWKPERWLAPLPEALVNAKVPGIYSHLMTFLGGRRACIGFKFSQLEMKVMLSALLTRFEFAPGMQKKILWQMGSVSTPILEDSADGTLKPQLPLEIRAVTL